MKKQYKIMWRNIVCIILCSIISLSAFDNIEVYAISYKDEETVQQVENNVQEEVKKEESEQEQETDDVQEEVKKEEEQKADDVQEAKKEESEQEQEVDDAQEVEKEENEQEQEIDDILEKVKNEEEQSELEQNNIQLGNNINNEIDIEDDPQYGRANGYIDESFFGIQMLSTEEEYFHNSKFNDYLIAEVIDVSKYQGDINWEKVKTAGVEYAFIRAGYRGYGEDGTLNTDSFFTNNIEQAISAGIQVGVYFFSQAINENEAKGEAEYVLNLIKNYKISLPVVIDYEYASLSDGLTGRLYEANLSREEATQICIEFCETIEDRGYTSMVYANKSMLENSLNSADISAKYMIWLANYGTSTSYEGDYQFWQYTQNGTVNGISGTVDMSFWYQKTNSIYNGIDYSDVYSYGFYSEKYPDIKRAYGNDQIAILKHFVNHGMNEGRQGKEEFNVYTYRNRYADLRKVYGENWKNYYVHYINHGVKEGRDASGSSVLIDPVTVYNGVDYSEVYDFNYYIVKYSDIAKLYGNDEYAALRHFVNNGMNEGRQGNEEFNVYTYRNRYADLRKVYGKNWKNYYMHYINHGVKEGRAASGTSKMLNPVAVYNGKDYSAVYDFNYYIERYPDIKKVYGDDDLAALRHFVNNGMNEGRQGNAVFNIYAYKSNYVDLSNAFGNNLKSYYLHYINNGRHEGRTGIRIGEIYSCKILETGSGLTTVQIEINLNDTINDFEEYYIIEVGSFDGNTIEKVINEKAGMVGADSIYITLNDEEISSILMNKIALAIKNTDGKMYITSKLVSISNPEAIATNTETIFKGTSKKGLQGITYASYNGGTDIVDARNANTKQTLLNLDLATIVSSTPKTGYKAYPYKDNTYYFSELNDLKKNISSLNIGYQQYLYGNSGTTPVAVTLCLLLSYNSENSYLIDPSVRTAGHSYYMLNVREEKACETLEALFLYLGETFGQKDCYVSNWILGNEINSSKAWNYSGSLDFDTYMDCYATAFRLLYTGVKSTKTGNTVSISLDNGWTAAPDTYAGKTTLDAFAQRIHAQNPNIKWSIAYHPYSYPLTRVDFWNDYSNTTDSLSTKYISMRNINVLTNYAATLENTYGLPSGSIRVLLTEQGYSYSGGDQNQAMAIVRGYYIAEFNDRIDAFIIRAVVDDTDEAQGKLYFGLMNSQHEKRIAFYVYEHMDSDIDRFKNISPVGYVSEENYNKFDEAKEIVCNTNWNGIVQGFNKDKLAAIK